MLSFRDSLRRAGRIPGLKREAEVKNLEKPPPIKCFYLYRKEDEIGVSGTGVVAVGVEFPSGQVLLEWVSKRTDEGSLARYETMDGMMEVHGHGGKTELRFYDDHGNTDR
jgi:hypothetical protein